MVYKHYWETRLNQWYLGHNQEMSLNNYGGLLIGWSNTGAEMRCRDILTCSHRTLRGPTISSNMLKEMGSCIFNFSLA